MVVEIALDQRGKVGVFDRLTFVVRRIRGPALTPPAGRRPVTNPARTAPERRDRLDLTGSVSRPAHARSRCRRPTAGRRASGVPRGSVVTYQKRGQHPVHTGHAGHRADHCGRRFSLKPALLRPRRSSCSPGGGSRRSPHACRAPPLEQAQDIAGGSRSTRRWRSATKEVPGPSQDWSLSDRWEWMRRTHHPGEQLERRGRRSAGFQ